MKQMLSEVTRTIQFSDIDYKYQTNENSIPKLLTFMYVEEEPTRKQTVINFSFNRRKFSLQLRVNMFQFVCTSKRYILF